MKPKFALSIAIVGVGLLAACTTHSFSDSDIAAAQQSIWFKFNSQPPPTPDTLVIVKEVHLIKVSDRKLTGYVKLQLSVDENRSGRGRTDWHDTFVTKSCEVNMAENSDTYIWQCE